MSTIRLERTPDDRGSCAGWNVYLGQRLLGWFDDEKTAAAVERHNAELKAAKAENARLRRGLERLDGAIVRFLGPTETAAEADDCENDLTQARFDVRGLLNGESP